MFILPLPTIVIVMVMTTAPQVYASLFVIIVPLCDSLFVVIPPTKKQGQQPSRAASPLYLAEQW
jgi:hypothetical protein